MVWWDRPYVSILSIKEEKEKKKVTFCLAFNQGIQGFVDKIGGVVVGLFVKHLNFVQNL